LAMKGFIFHAYQIYVERERGVEPTIHCSEELTAPTSFCSPFEPKKREKITSYRYYLGDRVFSTSRHLLD